MFKTVYFGTYKYYLKVHLLRDNVGLCDLTKWLYNLTFKVCRSPRDHHKKLVLILDASEFLFILYILNIKGFTMETFNIYD